MLKSIQEGLVNLSHSTPTDARELYNIPAETFESFGQTSKKDLPPEYPYPKRMKRDEYEALKMLLQIELIKFQSWVKNEGKKILVIVEGRDAAGKGGAIKRFMEHLNPRGSRVVALDKPTQKESGQWYFQRYLNHLPGEGEIVFFDRSWYNRAGVERVMNFCTERELDQFFTQVVELEKMLVESGVGLVKLYFQVGRVEQIRRLVERAKDPLKQWKLGEMDIESIKRFDQYTHAEEEMLAKTHHPSANWFQINSNDKKRARLEAIKKMLSRFDYSQETKSELLKSDKKICHRYRPK